jgi:hypothetical protein
MVHFPILASAAMRNLIHGLVLAALVATGGGYTAVLQGIAWGTMIIRYSQDSSLADGIDRTFSGKEPCQLCQRIALAESGDSERLPEETTEPVGNFDLFPTEVAELPIPVQGWDIFGDARHLLPSAPFLDRLFPPPEAA